MSLIHTRRMHTNISQQHARTHEHIHANGYALNMKYSIADEVLKLWFRASVQGYKGEGYLLCVVLTDKFSVLSASHTVSVFSDMARRR